MRRFHVHRPRYHSTQRPLFRSGWYPRSLGSGLAAWYDATDTSTLYTTSALATNVSANSDPVGGWKDKSGNGQHAIQATAGFRPLYKTNIKNGRPAILFDGTDDFLAKAFTLAQPCQVMVAGSYVAVADGKTIYDGTTGNGMRHFVDAGAADNIYAGTALISVQVTAAGTWYIYDDFYNGASSQLSRNAGAKTTGNAGVGSGDGVTLGAFGVGATGWANCYIAEMIIANRALTATEEANAFAYLNRRWGVY